MKTATEIADEIVVEVVGHGHADNASVLIDAESKHTIVNIVQRAIEDSFRIGFEHAVAGGEEAGKVIQHAKLPLVMYFDNEADRREMIDAVQMAHPTWAAVKIPERKS